MLFKSFLKFFPNLCGVVLYCNLVVYHLLSPDTNIRFLLTISIIFIYHIFACFIPEIILHFHLTALPWGSLWCWKEISQLIMTAAAIFYKACVCFLFGFWKPHPFTFWRMAFSYWVFIHIFYLENATYKTWYMLKRVIERGTGIQVFFQRNGSSSPYLKNFFSDLKPLPSLSSTQN